MVEEGAVARIDVIDTTISRPRERALEIQRIEFVSRLRVLMLTLGLALTRTPVAQSQQLAGPQGAANSEASIIARAEAEGAAFRAKREPAPAPRCVEGREAGPAKSGDFIIGGTLGGGRPLRAGLVGKIWWRPAHASAKMPRLKVRGRNLSTLRDTVYFATATVAWSVTPGQVISAERREYFFPSGFSVPTAGRWLVVATSGDNWGCFIITAV